MDKFLTPMNPPEKGLLKFQARLAAENRTERNEFKFIAGVTSVLALCLVSLLGKIHLDETREFHSVSSTEGKNRRQTRNQSIVEIPSKTEGVHLYWIL